MVLGLGVQWTVILRWPDRLYKGRLLTAWIRRRVRLLQGGATCRISQIIGIGVLTRTFPAGIQWIAFIALYLDDYLTGNDDRWKRFKDEAHNKVKWLMELPAPPVRQEGTA